MNANPSVGLQPDLFRRFFSSVVGGSLAVLVSLFPVPQAQAADGTWTLNNTGNWSGSGNWAGGVIADGAGATGDFTQLDITANRTVTIDGAVASRTLGILLIGDSTGSPGFSNYSISTSGGGTLTFNNNGSDALLTQVVSSGNNSISAPIILADHLRITNDSSSTLTLSGSMTGARSITLQGSGTGTTTISGVIGSDVTGVVQDSATSQLTLSGLNTFSSGVTINQGTVLANGSQALGTGLLTLGDSTGNADATLLVGSTTVSNAITVQAGSSGNTLKISSNGGTRSRLEGDIVLNNTLTLATNAPGGANRVANTLPYMQASGVISGTGNLILDVSGLMVSTNDANSSLANSLTVTGTVTTSGSVTNAGTGEGWATISGNITNASSVNQSSATSMLTLSGSNSYTGATNITAGVLRLTTANAIAGSSSLTVEDGGSLLLSLVTINSGPTINLAGAGTFYNSGALVAVNSVTLNLPIHLTADATILSSQTTNTTLTLSGPITGSGRTLTAGGANNVTMTGSVDTASGGLTKIGTGNVTLSGSNSFSGVTRIEEGNLIVNNVDALAGGGDITFDGGALRHSASNELDFGSRIVNSTGPISIDTAGRNVSYSGIVAGNLGGLAKLGTGRLTLSGTNDFSGPVVVNAGVLAVSGTSALPSVGDGLIFVDANGALNSGGAYADVQAWLDSDNLAANSTGAIALTGNSSENIDFTGYNGLSLGASSNSTYTGSLTAASGVYRLGGGGANLTLSADNALTGTNGLVVSAGNVILTGANDLTGATTVSSNTLTLSGGSGGVAGSDVSVTTGATLAVVANTAATPVTRAESITLNSGTFTLTGNSTSNSSDVVTDAFTIGTGGNSTVTLTQANARNVLLSADSLGRQAGGTALIRGTNLGVNSIASATANSVNMAIANPVLVGGTGVNTTDGGILVGAVGDTSTSGTGFGTTGGLLTVDAANGVRLLGASEYKTSITDGQTQLDNVRLSKATAGTATTTVNLNTTVNSLSINATGNATAAVQLAGTGTLTLNSGVIYYGSTTATSASGVSNAINFNGREGIILSGGSGALNLSGILANTGGNGITVSGNRTVTFSGADANTYTGTTSVNGGTLSLSKTAGVTAVTGDLVVNSGGTVNFGASNQIADSASVSVNGGSFAVATSGGGAISETIQSLLVGKGGSVTSAGTLTVNGDTTVSGGGSLTTLNTGAGSGAGQFVFGGALNLSEGGSLNLRRSQSLANGGLYENIAWIDGGLNITNATTGAYTAISIGHGIGIGQKGGQVILNSDVTFTGNDTNANTVLIDSPVGTGGQGVMALTGTASGQRGFDVGNGAAVVDLRITAPLIDGTAGASGLTKTGLGTLDLTGENTYTGSTLVSAGTLLINGSSVSATTVNGGVLGGEGTISNSVNIGNSGTLAPGNSPGMLSTGDLSLTGTNATIAMEIAGTGAGEYDQINVTGAVNLDGNGQIELTLLAFAPQVNDLFFLILNDDSDAINGTLFGLAQGATFSASGYTWQVSYVGNSGSSSFTGGNDLALQVVPEPATWLLLAGGLVSLSLMRRRRGLR